jgi:hypothetical protein
MKLQLVIALITLSHVANAGEPPSCPVPGKAVQWIADYCLARTETDDLIAAGPCIDEETASLDGTTACAVKTRYKARLCRLLVGSGARSGTVAACASDPSFSGNIVRDNAVN